MMYHPDVLLSADSTAAERDAASKDFARINAAYEMLTGGAKGGVDASSGVKENTSSEGYSYQPPHRRASGTYGSPRGGKSTNWEDYMPNYDEEDAKYDAGGDSFGAIFSDILTGAAGAAAGVASGNGYSGGSIFGDFIDFLEGNIDGFESGYSDDSNLLRYGSFGEVAAEMDETDILVSSLETKLSMVENELMQTTADLSMATKFSERLDLEERVAELKAREKVAKGYLKKGKKRLIKLRERYKELMVEGRGGRGYGDGSGSSSSYDGAGRSASGGSGRSYSSRGSSTESNSYDAPVASTYSSPTTSATSPTPSSSPAPAESSPQSWRSEGFSSTYGGRSSSSRRRSSRRREGSAVGGEEVSATSDSQTSQRQRRLDNNAYSSSSRGSNESRGGSPLPGQYDNPWVPPHRRTQSSMERNAEDKKRLRELKVEEDFDKLKRELGM